LALQKDLALRLQWWPSSLQVVIWLNTKRSHANFKNLPESFKRAESIHALNPGVASESALVLSAENASGQAILMMLGPISCFTQIDKLEKLGVACGNGLTYSPNTSRA
jgi:hypothetical protein